MPDIGWFGKFELEGMAMGKVVIAYVSGKLYDKYKPSVYRTIRSTFKEDLESLLEHVTERNRLAKEGPSYIKKITRSNILLNGTRILYIAACKNN